MGSSKIGSAPSAPVGSAGFPPEADLPSAEAQAISDFSRISSRELTLQFRRWLGDTGELAVGIDANGEVALSLPPGMAGKNKLPELVAQMKSAALQIAVERGVTFQGKPVSAAVSNLDSQDGFSQGTAKGLGSLFRAFVNDLRDPPTSGGLGQKILWDWGNALDFQLGQMNRMYGAGAAGGFPPQAPYMQYSGQPNFWQRASQYQPVGLPAGVRGVQSGPDLASVAAQLTAMGVPASVVNGQVAIDGSLYPDPTGAQFMAQTLSTQWGMPISVSPNPAWAAQGSRVTGQASTAAGASEQQLPVAAAASEAEASAIPENAKGLLRLVEAQGFSYELEGDQVRVSHPRLSPDRVDFFVNQIFAPVAKAKGLEVVAGPAALGSPAGVTAQVSGDGSVKIDGAFPAAGMALDGVVYGTAGALAAAVAAKAASSVSGAGPAINSAASAAAPSIAAPALGGGLPGSKKKELLMWSGWDGKTYQMDYFFGEKDSEAHKAWLSQKEFSKNETFFNNLESKRKEAERERRQSGEG